MSLNAPRVLAILLLSIVMVHGAAAQQLPGDRAPRRISERPLEFPETFTSVRSLTSLPDGRLVVSDASDKRIYLIDFAKGLMTPLARSGNGPREYQVPGGTSRTTGGGVMIFDQLQQRFLPISRVAEVGDVIAIPAELINSTTPGPNADQVVRDTVGGLHGLGRLGRRRAAVDTLPLLRFHGDGRVLDTTAMLLQQEFRSVPGPNPRMSLGLIVGFSPEDVWAVAPDGRVAIVRAEPYRVEWYALGGTPVRGPAIRFDPLPVTPADREAALAQFRTAPPPRVTTNGVSRTIAPPPVEPPLRGTKPPFPPQVPRIDERGRLWVERSGAAEARARVYDLFDRRGTLTDRIELPAGSRLVGFDATWMYTVRKDDDDLQYLQRYRVP